MELQLFGSADAPRCGLHGDKTNCLLVFNFSLELIGTRWTCHDQRLIGRYEADLLQMKVLCDTPARDFQNAQVQDLHMP